MDVTSIGLTVTEHSALIFPHWAVMVVEPTARAVTSPSVTVAILVLDDDHVTVLSVALSGDTVAVSSTVSPV